MKKLLRRFIRQWFFLFSDWFSIRLEYAWESCKLRSFILESYRSSTVFIHCVCNSSFVLTPRWNHLYFERKILNEVYLRSVNLLITADNCFILRAYSLFTLVDNLPINNDIVQIYSVRSAFLSHLRNFYQEIKHFIEKKLFKWKCLQ